MRVMERTALTDFLEDADSPGDGAQTDTAGQVLDGAGEADPPDLTSVWSSERRDCARCGETVHRCWPDGDGLVCTDCVDW